MAPSKTEKKMLKNCNNHFHSNQLHKKKIERFTGNTIIPRHTHGVAHYFSVCFVAHMDMDTYVYI